MADYIANNSLGNAVLVFGDTNARYTSAGENIRVFEEQENMANPWVELILDGVQPEEGIDAITCENPSTVKTCETVDKILYSPLAFFLCWMPVLTAGSYRGSPALTLEATSWAYEDEKFLSNNGSILSDHNPIASDFSWTKSDSFRLSDLYGGPHG